MNTAQYLKLFEDNRELKHDIAQVKARAALQALGAPERLAWTYVSSAITRNATIAIVDLIDSLYSNSDTSVNLTNIALIVARLWESLAELTDRSGQQAAIMNAATAYEIAGFQANSMCLVNRLAKNVNNDSPDLLDLIVTFMSRKNLLTVQLANHLKSPSSDVKDLSTKLSEDSEIDIELELFSQSATAACAQGLSLAAHSFLSGETAPIEESIAILKECQQLFGAANLAIEFNLITSLLAILPIMWGRSVWKLLSSQIDSNNHWKRYAKLLGRGFSDDLISGRSVSQLWPSQQEALEQGLLDQTSSKIIKMPTSAGKTRIAEMAIVQTLIENPNAACVYIAPFRALASQLEQDFSKVIPDLGFSVTTVLGGFDSDEFEQVLLEKSHLLITTPEKLDMMLRLRPDFTARIKLIVLDEAHLIEDHSRGIKFELLLSRIARKFSQCKFLVLSAVIAQETLEDFAQWFNSSKTGIITSDWRPAIQRIAHLRWSGEKGFLRYHKLDDSDNLYEFLPNIIQQSVYEYVNEETGRKRRPKFPDTRNKSHVAAETAVKFAEIGPALVFTPTPRNAEAIGSALFNRLEYCDLVQQALPVYFSVSKTYSYQVALEWLGSDHPVTKMLNRGIAIHHGKLPEALRKAVEVDFRSGTYRIIIATSTLAQGVNLPVRTVVIHSCWRTVREGFPERISAREYWNIAGRAGRAGNETEGTLVHLVLDDTDADDYAHFLAERNRIEPINTALFQLLQSILENRLSEDALKSVLDPEILALAVEEGFNNLSDEHLNEILRKSLVGIQAERKGQEILPLVKRFGEIKASIGNLVPDPALREIYSTTGLATASCERLRQFIENNAERLRILLTSATSSDMDELVSILRSASVPLREMQSDYTFSGDETLLLQNWMATLPIEKIRLAHSSNGQDGQALSRYIEDVFGYKFPWIIAAFIRIACHLLELKSEMLSTTSKFASAMVKFGVALPAAAWAMEMGVPFRQTAIAVARRFYSESNGDCNYQDFANWFGQFSGLELEHEFGITGIALKDVLSAAVRGTSNPLLVEEGVIVQIPFAASVVGIVYSEERLTAYSQVQIGSLVELHRDYDNIYDRNAVIAMSGKLELGYVARLPAQVIAPEIDSGRDLIGKVAKTGSDRKPIVFIVINDRSSL